ncbi:phage portal protein [Lysobacter sp. LF1]|uniref:Phage portal protein n=1 Tax=Lysobacter stagni TaxID=3045172 RepID=A0ABT6XKQ1_9GAMM|nr:phage portal protein [Lysobacter sp. LF1]MDI9240746.1 phage portal protein [Lysobacter sp. LF1]
MSEVQILDRHGQPIRAQDTAHTGASRTSRELRTWLPALESADSELEGERDTLATRSYDLERNNGIAGGAVRTNVDNIIGTGLRLSAKPDYRALGKPKEWADEWSRGTEAKWRTFANVQEFDAARNLTFGGQSVVMLRTAFLAGDGLALAHWLPDRPGAKWATCSQLVDPARLGTPPGQTNGARMRDGVEINELGEAIAYQIRKAHPGDLYQLGAAEVFERVPARTPHGRRRVVHLFEQLRSGQTRGKALLAPVMAAFKMLDHYQRTELQTVIVNSLIAAFIETPLKAEEIADLFGSTDEFMKSRNGWDVKLEGAGVIPLHPGDKLNAFTPTRPNGAYEKFVEAILRYISTGLHMPYELLMKDFSKTNYSSARAALLEAWRYFNARRQWFATYWANPIYELWLEEAVARGEVDAPDFYENRAAYCACAWIGPGRGWVDPMKEAQASGERIRNCVSTLEREAAEQGLDWEEVLQQRATEQRYAESLGLRGAESTPPPAAIEQAEEQIEEIVSRCVDRHMAQRVSA